MHRLEDCPRVDGRACLNADFVRQVWQEKEEESLGVWFRVTKDSCVVCLPTTLTPDVSKLASMFVFHQVLSMSLNVPNPQIWVCKTGLDDMVTGVRNAAPHISWEDTEHMLNSFESRESFQSLRVQAQGKWRVVVNWQRISLHKERNVGLKPVQLRARKIDGSVAANESN